MYVTEGKDLFEAKSTRDPRKSIVRIEEQEEKRGKAKEAEAVMACFAATNGLCFVSRLAGS